MGNRQFKKTDRKISEAIYPWIIHAPTLPIFPQTLRHLDCSHCEFINLPELPESIEMLFVVKCDNLIFFPKLPQNLKILNCSGCKKLSYLPELPQYLLMLKCVFCNFKTLPILPKHLTDLDCYGCENLLSLGILPPELQFLDCRLCIKLESLPDLPITLLELKCNGCIFIIPKLPPSLIKFEADYLCVTLAHIVKLLLSETLSDEDFLYCKNQVWNKLFIEQIRLDSENLQNIWSKCETVEKKKIKEKLNPYFYSVLQGIILEFL